MQTNFAVTDSIALAIHGELGRGDGAPTVPSPSSQSLYSASAPSFNLAPVHAKSTLNFSLPATTLLPIPSRSEGTISLNLDSPLFPQQLRHGALNLGESTYDVFPAWPAHPSVRDWRDHTAIPVTNLPALPNLSSITWPSMNGPITIYDATPPPPAVSPTRDQLRENTLSPSTAFILGTAVGIAAYFIAQKSFLKRGAARSVQTQTRTNRRNHIKLLDNRLNDSRGLIAKAQRPEWTNRSNRQARLIAVQIEKIGVEIQALAGRINHPDRATSNTQTEKAQQTFSDTATAILRRITKINEAITALQKSPEHATAALGKLVNAISKAAQQFQGDGAHLANQQEKALLRTYLAQQLGNFRDELNTQLKGIQYDPVSALQTFHAKLRRVEELIPLWHKLIQIETALNAHTPQLREILAHQKLSAPRLDNIGERFLRVAILSLCDTTKFFTGRHLTRIVSIGDDLAYHTIPELCVLLARQSEVNVAIEKNVALRDSLKNQVALIRRKFTPTSADISSPIEGNGEIDEAIETARKLRAEGELLLRSKTPLLALSRLHCAHALTERVSGELASYAELLRHAAEYLERLESSDDSAHGAHHRSEFRSRTGEDSLLREFESFAHARDNAKVLLSSGHLRQANALLRALVEYDLVGERLAQDERHETQAKFG